MAGPSPAKTKLFGRFPSCSVAKFSPDSPAQIATGDLDVPIVGQLPAANLPFGDEFEPGPVEVIGFEAPFRREGFQ